MKIPVSSFASEANAVTANPTFTKTRRQSIIDLYTDYASDHVNLYVDKGKVKKISRERFERNFLEAIDKSDWPFECKMSTYVSVSLYPFYLHRNSTRSSAKPSVYPGAHVCKF